MVPKVCPTTPGGWIANPAMPNTVKDAVACGGWRSFTSAVFTGSNLHMLIAAFSLRRTVAGRSNSVFLTQTLGTGDLDRRLLVFKMGFPDVARKNSELDFLKRIKDAAKVDPANVKGLPRLVWSKEIPSIKEDMFGCELAPVISEFLPAKMVDRRCTMFTTEPAGRPLSAFKGPKQFLGAIIDAIAAHWRFLKLKGLHRDISEGNVLLGPRANFSDWEKDPEGRGLLSDVGEAVHYVLGQPHQPSGSPGRTGTMPFMAIDILEHPDAEPLPRHDLESFMYLIVWVMAMYPVEGTGSNRELNEDQPGERTLADRLKHKWNTPGEMSGAADSKRAFIMSLYSDVVDRFAPYWQPLVATNFLSDLAELFRPLYLPPGRSGHPGPRQDVTKDQVVTILNGAYVQLPDC
jgi:hypothetical protein